MRWNRMRNQDRTAVIANRHTRSTRPSPAAISIKRFHVLPATREETYGEVTVERRIYATTVSSAAIQFRVVNAKWLDRGPELFTEVERFDLTAKARSLGAVVWLYDLRGEGEPTDERKAQILNPSPEEESASCLGILLGNDEGQDPCEVLLKITARKALEEEGLISFEERRALRSRTLRPAISTRTIAYGIDAIRRCLDQWVVDRLATLARIVEMSKRIGTHEGANEVIRIIENWARVAISFFENAEKIVIKVFLFALLVLSLYGFLHLVALP